MLVFKPGFVLHLADEPCVQVPRVVGWRPRSYWCAACLGAPYPILDLANLPRAQLHNFDHALLEFLENVTYCQGAAPTMPSQDKRSAPRQKG